ncbi:hypothetical protein [Hymenobacter rubripertinctus]|nr:hypothetical protein [Hymenobacter rubripertinctus]
MTASDTQIILWFLAGAAALLWGNATRHRYPPPLPLLASPRPAGYRAR